MAKWEGEGSEAEYLSACTSFSALGGLVADYSTQLDETTQICRQVRGIMSASV